jgi:group I intron endonuclease
MIIPQVNNNRICGVYEIVNTVNGKRYIGSSVNINRRWGGHRNDLDKGNHRNSHLQHAWNKYGKDCFTFTILECCDRNVLTNREQFYLDTILPEYNIYPNAGSSLGVKGYIPWNKGKKGTQIPWNKGLKLHPLSDEHKYKLSQSHKGKPAHNKGIPHSTEHKRKISQSNQGRIVSIETRKKIGIANKGKTPASKGKPSPLRGIKKSDEFKQQMSLSIMKWWEERRANR